MSSLRKKAELFTKNFSSTACKTSLKLVIARLKILRNVKSAQVKASRKEIAQLLQGGQEESARVKVEHVIREEKAMTAYEMIELYCEIIVSRLPAIETQKECPTDLKEAVCSVMFAQARCTDLPELKVVSKLLAHKYGKDFTKAAIELRPNSGVSPSLVEKLSANSPNVEAKIKVLTAIASEHGINWKPKQPEGQLEQPKVELLGGSSSFPVAAKRTSETPKSEFVSQVVQKQDAVPSLVKHQSLATRENSNVATTNSVHEGIALGSKFVETQHIDVRSEEQSTMLHQKSLSMNFKDAASAAEAAAMSAEMASMAASAAADFALQVSDPKQQATVLDVCIDTRKKGPLDSKQSEPDAQVYGRQRSAYKQKISSETGHRGDGLSREPVKEDSNGSRSNEFLSRNNSTSVDNDRKDGAFFDRTSSEQIAVERYQLEEMATIKEYQTSVEKGQKTPKTTATGNMEKQFEHNQNEGSFMRIAINTNSVNASSSRSTTSVASPVISSDNFKMHAKTQESTEAFSPDVPKSIDAVSPLPEQAAVRGNTFKKKNSLHDYDDDGDGSFKSTLSSPIFHEESASNDDQTHDTLEVETWKKEFTIEETNQDHLSRLHSSKSNNISLAYDEYQWDVEQDNYTEIIFPEEVSVHSFRLNKVDEVLQVHNKSDQNDAPFSSPSPFVVEEAVFLQDTMDSCNLIGKFKDNSEQISDGKQDSVDNHHSSPLFDDDNGSDVGDVIDLDKIVSDDEMKLNKSKSEDASSPFSHEPTMSPESELIMVENFSVSESTRSARKDFIPVDSSHFDDYGHLDSNSPSNDKAERFLGRNQNYETSSFKMESEVSRHHEKEHKINNFSQGLSARAHENPYQGGKKWSDRRQAADAHDELQTQMHSDISTTEVATAKRVDVQESDDEDSDSEKGFKLGVLAGGLRNRQRNPLYSPVGEDGFSYKPVRGASSPATEKIQDSRRHAGQGSQSNDVLRYNARNPDPDGSGRVGSQSQRSRRSSRVAENEQLAAGEWDTLPPDEDLIQRSEQRSQTDASEDNLSLPSSKRSRRPRKIQEDSSAIGGRSSAVESYESSRLQNSELFTNERLLLTSNDARGTKSSASYDTAVHEETDMQPPRPAGGVSRSKRTSTMDSSRDEMGFATESSIDVGAGHRRRWEDPSKDPFTVQKLRDQMPISKDKYKRDARIYTQSSDADGDEEVDRPQPSGLSGGGRRTRGSTEESTMQEFKTDQRPKPRDRNDRETVSSAHAYDAEIEKEMDQSPRHSIVSVRSKEHLRKTGILGRDSKRVPEEDLDESEDPDAKPKVHSRYSSSARTEEKHSTPVKDTANLSLKEESVTSSSSRYSRREKYSTPVQDTMNLSLKEESVTSSSRYSRHEKHSTVQETLDLSLKEESSTSSPRYSRREKHSAPIRETLKMSLEEESEISSPRSSKHALSPERDTKRSSKPQILNPERSSAPKLEARPIPTRAPEHQSSLRSVRDPRQKELSPVKQTNLLEEQPSISPVRNPRERKPSASKQTDLSEQQPSVSPARDLRQKERSPVKQTSLPKKQSSVPSTHDPQQKETSQIRQADSAPTASPGKKEESGSTSGSTADEKSKGPSHVHPKLPTDFDSFLANFHSLRSNARHK